MRKTVLLLVSTVLAVLLGFGVALLDSEAAFAATDTYFNTSQITIPNRGEATPYPSSISVSGLGTVTDVDLKLSGFSHTYPDDVTVELMGPSGAHVMAMSDAGGEFDVSNIDLTLDDEATSTLPSGKLASGTFRPSSALSIFDGTNPNGVWEIYVDDVGQGDSGHFAGGWSLTITSEGPVEPPPPDTTSPETTLHQVPPEFDSHVSPRISFRSSETGSTFECKLDDGAYESCSSPKQVFQLTQGVHTFAARAKDAAGNVDESPANFSWTVDTLDPKLVFTERPGNRVGPRSWDEWVTNDRTPTWAWTVKDTNLAPGSERCYLYSRREYDSVVQCSSPYTFATELPDGYYSFELSAGDKAGNRSYDYNYLEVDTVAPTIVSTKPTGRTVSPSADIVITFDDTVYGSASFVNIYKKGSDTPLDVRRYAYNKKIELSPKNTLKHNTWYTVKVTTEVNDGVNNLETPKTWSFKTESQ